MSLASKIYYNFVNFIKLLNSDPKSVTSKMTSFLPTNDIIKCDKCRENSNMSANNLCSSN